MGIPGFFNYIKNQPTYNKWKTDNRLLKKSIMRRNFNDGKILEPAYIKYDYIFFDFQSGIYDIKKELKQYDYLIRLLFYYDFNNGQRQIVKDINSLIELHNKFSGFIHSNNIDDLLISVNTIQQINPQIVKKIIAKIQTIKEDRFITYIAQLIVKRTLDIAIENNILTKDIYIWFDGIPSVSKIKEQVHRQIKIKVNSYIVDNINEDWKNDTQNIDKIYGDHLFAQYLSTNFSIPIGVGTDVCNKIKELLKSSGITNINEEEKYGEAEHQMMRYMLHKPQFKGKRILLSSPDADLILLAMIMNCQGYLIDIRRSSFIDEETIIVRDGGNGIEDFTNIHNYKYDVHHILIRNLMFNFVPNEEWEVVKRKILDICFILIILGDDFLPTIPNIFKKNILDIINFCNTNNQYVIDQTYNINIDNFISVMKLINTLKLDSEKITYMKNKTKYTEQNKNVNEKYEKLYNFYKYSNNYLPLYHRLLYENGIKDRKLLKSFPPLNFKQDKLDVHIMKQMCDNYFEGCGFVRDLYFNNNLKNYNWFYKYDESPRIEFIIEYLNVKKTQLLEISKEEKDDGEKKQDDGEKKQDDGDKDIFDYGKHIINHDNISYMNRQQYIYYRNTLIRNGLISIIKRIITHPSFINALSAVKPTAPLGVKSVVSSTTSLVVPSTTPLANTLAASSAKPPTAQLVVSSANPLAASSATPSAAKSVALPIFNKDEYIQELKTAHTKESTKLKFNKFEFLCSQIYKLIDDTLKEQKQNELLEWALSESIITDNEKDKVKEYFWKDSQKLPCWQIIENQKYKDSVNTQYESQKTQKGFDIYQFTLYIFDNIIESSRILHPPQDPLQYIFNHQNLLLEWIEQKKFDDPSISSYLQQYYWKLEYGFPPLNSREQYNIKTQYHSYLNQTYNEVVDLNYIYDSEVYQINTRQNHPIHHKFLNDWIIENFPQQGGDITLQKLMQKSDQELNNLTEPEIKQACKLLFRYENIHIMYEGCSKEYFENCINYDTNISIPTDLTDINSVQFAGGYYDKYNKYRNKILADNKKYLKYLKYKSKNQKLFG